METQNKTITEDYVSFETAKLLKEKGFDLPTYMVWYEHLPVSIGGVVNVDKTALDYFYYNETTEHKSLYNNKKEKPNYVYGDIYSAPTLQMACKWLREVHRLHILCYMRWKTWKFEIEEIPNCESDYDKNGFASYEQAAEEGIKYCLTKLIKQ